MNKWAVISIFLLGYAVGSCQVGLKNNAVYDEEVNACCLGF